MDRMRGLPVLFGLVLLPALAGPVAAQTRCCIEELKLGRVAVTELIYPRPPDTARIRYEGWLRSDRDLGRKGSIFGAIGRVLWGGEEEHTAINRPYDVYALDGRIYVSDGVSGGIAVFDGIDKEVRVIGSMGPGQLMKPMGLGGDGTGRVYVADPTADRVVVFGPDGEYETALGGANVLLNPVDVAVDRARDRIYVVDSHLHQVVVFNMAGEVVGRLGADNEDVGEKRARLLEYSQQASVVEAGAVADSTAVHPPSKYLPEPSDLMRNRSGDPGEFKFPSHAAVGPDGTLYVSDAMNFRIQLFDPAGSFIRAFGALGDVAGTFSRPKGVSVDSDGHVYVADAAFNNVQIFDSEGRLLLVFGSLGAGDGQLWMPLGMHIDKDWIYVTDRFNDRIQIFRYLGAG
jgi:DNA-binding beta-propeller fold protein YncE